MPTSFGALCSDFYVNAKLALKMDLPAERETILHLMDRIRKAVPSMTLFQRYENEITLESPRRDSEYRWISLRRTHLRTGHVNPASMPEAYKFHRLVLHEAPFHLTISPLDVDSLELLFGFDLECRGDQDEVVWEALYAGTPLARLLRTEEGSDTRITDVQPLFGLQIGEVQAFFEVKTRTRCRRTHTGRDDSEPLSLYLTVRRYGPLARIEDLDAWFETLRGHAEALAVERLVPDLLTPIARQITSSSA